MGTSLSLASYPWDARYVDGNYEIKSKVTDIDGNPYEILNPVNFKIDNFKPFIRSVGIYSGSGGSNDEQIYYREWNSQDATAGQLRLAGGTRKNPLSIFNQVVTIYAVASEPMRVVKAKLPPFVNNFVVGTTVPGSDNTRWQFQFSTINFIEDACYEVFFEGEDLQGNAVGQGNRLLDLPEPSTCNTGTGSTFYVPHRTGANSWSAGPAQGADAVHKFRVGNCHMVVASNQSESNGPPCFTSNEVTYDITSSAPGEKTGSIKMIIAGNTDGMTFRWTNAVGEEVGDSQDLADLPAGLYCVEVKYDCCSFYDCIEVGECLLQVVADVHYPTSGMANGAISLTMTNGMEPYQIQWDNGTSANPFSGLAVGNYKCTVTDAYHCVSVQSFALQPCPAIQLEVNAIVSAPSACDATDGVIKVLSLSQSGGVPPYTRQWFDADGNPLSGEPTDIGPGTYCLVATDAHGCTGSQCFEVQSEHSPAVEPVILPSCDNGESGYLGVYANDTGGDQYDFAWEDGTEDHNAYYSERAHLAPGTYCVTITAAGSDCSVVRCFEVPTVVPDMPLQVGNPAVAHPCPNTKNGSIDLTVKGGIPPYSFHWTGLDLPSDQEDQAGLGEGTYTVTVTDYCGASVFKNIVLKPLEIKLLQAVSGCRGKGKVYVVVSNGNPPYSYAWSNGAVASELTDVNTNDYCVTVTDARGCQVAQCVHLQNIEAVETGRVNVCSGIGQSGSVTYAIFNPLNEKVQVFNESIQVGPISTQSNFAVTIGQLSGNISYHVEIRIGQCVEHFVVRLAIADLSRKFNHFDGTSCVYDLYCHGELIEEEGLKETPGFDFGNATNHPCAVERFCGTQSVGWIEMNKKTVRALEYGMMLNTALQGNLYPDDYIEQLINLFNSKNLDNCDKVKYCEATLEITFTPLPIHGDGTITPWTDNCVKLDCGLFYDEILCGKLPEGIDLSNFNLDCEARRYNALQLIYWYDQMKAAHPDFEFSDLGKLVKKLTDLYNSNDPNGYKVRCMFVTYCRFNFEVISVTDIETVACSDPLSAEPGVVSGCQLQQYEDEPDVIVCPNYEGEELLFPIPIDEIYDKTYNLSSPGGESTHVFNPANGASDFLKNFGFVRSEGASNPKGLLQSADGKTSTLDYTYKMRFESRQKAPDFLFYEDNWDTETLVYMEKIDANKISLHCETPQNTWEHVFSSNDLLMVAAMAQSDGQIVVTGTFRGNLNFDAVTMQTSSTLAGFIAVVGLDGVITNLQTIQNVKADSKLEVRAGDGNFLVSGTSNSTWVSLNGQGQLALNAGGMFTFQLADQNPLQLAVSSLSTSGTVRFVKSISPDDYSRTTYLFQGIGSVNYKSTAYTLSTDGLVLLTLDKNGALLWVKKIILPVIEGEVDVTYDGEYDVYLAMTFTGSLNMDGQVLVSGGGKDILLGKINKNGIYEAIKTYGSPDDEVVKKCFFNSSILYFGGEYAGLTTKRQLGHSTYIRLGNNADPLTTKAYMGYLLEEELAAFGTSAPRGANANREMPPEVYPNPFSGELMVRKLSSLPNEYLIRVFDVLGNLVVQQQEKAETGVNEYRVKNILPMQPGIYIIRITNSQGIEWAQKVVKN